MAAAPLFEQDLDTLKAKLRLTAVTSADTIAMLLGAMQKARVKILDRLGSARATEILATALSDNPLTAEAVMRAKAATCETSLVRLYLLRTMPSLFLDAAPTTPEVWNETGILRDPGVRTEKEIQRLGDEIEEYLQDLAGGSPDNSEVQVSVFGAEGTNCSPMSKVGVRL
jgi:hypothetical protein